jgi:hypothetical protein
MDGERAHIGGRETMKVQLKGIVRGTYSDMQEAFEETNEPAVLVATGKSLEEVVVGLALPEWIYVLKVNGKRIVDPVRYLKRKGIWNQCVRS